jgi:MOSC domain
MLGSQPGISGSCRSPTQPRSRGPDSGSPSPAPAGLLGCSVSPPNRSTATWLPARWSGIYLAAETAGSTVSRDTATAIAGAGLDGDRYARGDGTFFAPGVPGHHLTLIDADVLASAGIAPGDARRNVVTRGVDLDAAIGREFRVGPVVCRGYRRAEPCAHLQRLVGPGTLRALVHRGGLRADILVGGQIAVGDSVVISA